MDPSAKKPPEVLCTTQEDAVWVTEEFGRRYDPLRPSLIVTSGHGCYPVILFKEPLVVAGPEDLKKLELLGRRYHNALHAIACERGFTGAVEYCDPAKVLRLPGTLNWKDPQDPRPVCLTHENDARFNVCNLDEILPPLGPTLFAVGAADSLCTMKQPEVVVTLATKKGSEITEHWIAALEEAHPLFGPTWAYQRTDLPDQTCSGYDMSLANIGVALGLEDQQIADLLMENRSRFPHKKQDRRGASYGKYLQRTIARAHEQRGAGTESVEGQELDGAAACTAPDINSEQAVLDRGADAALPGSPANDDTEPQPVADETVIENGSATKNNQGPCESDSGPGATPAVPQQQDAQVATTKAPAAPSETEKDGCRGRQAVAAPALDNASIFERMAPYPAPMGPAAYYGLTGDFIHLIEPHTEADPNFMLAQFLAYAGNLFGRSPFVWVAGQKHHANLFATGVGATSSGRKGSASGPLDLFFTETDPNWVMNHQSGLSSGEGLIWCVRDPIIKRERVKGKEGGYEDVVVDPGVDDKRVLVKQSEFFGALQVMRRMGNTLSPVIRDAWDKGFLKSMTKNSPAQATDAHISIIGNITKEELLRGMLGGEMDNGFANRFLWLCSKRSKSLPEGGRLQEEMHGGRWKELVTRLQGAYESACKTGALSRDEDAANLWGRDNAPEIGEYSKLTRDRHGLFGGATSRAAAQVLRLSMVYALLDCANEIRRPHLEAALEVWRYCEDSAKYIFGDSLGDPTADAILRALRQSAAGLSRQDMHSLFGGNQKAAEIQRALLVLHNAGLARFDKEEKEGRGRKPERWFASVWKDRQA